MNQDERNALSGRIERVALLFRWLLLAIALSTVVLRAIPWEWLDLAAATLIILAHNAFAHMALARERPEWFATRANFAIYLGETTLLVYFTGADESLAFMLYPLLILGLTAYKRNPRTIAAATALCLLLYSTVLSIEYVLVGFTEPWGALAAKMLTIAAAGWVVGVLSDQLQRNAEAARRHADALATSEATLRTVLNAAADLILVIDASDRITDANEHACAFLRLQRDDIIGRRPRAFLFDDGTLGVKFASLRAHGEFRGEMIVIDADQNEHTVDMLIRAFLRNGDRYFVALAQDITERKELEEATRLTNENLAQLNRELRQVDQMKRDFFNTVSMRMRSPVAAILGYADMLLADELGELSPEQRKAVQTCRRSAHRLLEMVDEAIRIGATSHK